MPIYSITLKIIVLSFWILPVHCFERLVIHRPAEIPEPNPRAKKAILAANETSFHITKEKDRAKTRNMIEIPSKDLLEFIRSLLLGLIHYCGCRNKSP
jgi:hypothetical protein